jgi:3-phenylpropionate/trans-cinnamate dioxygenase ferredoxin reductase subunit
MEGTAVEIISITEVGPETLAFELQTPPDFDARPGQFVQVRATVDGEQVTRHYSISAPRVTDTVEITVGIDPAGTLTPWLARRNPGDTVEIDGPFGRVYYEGERSVVLIAAGPGIGAAVGIAERVLSAGGEATLLYRTDMPVHERRLARLSRTGAAVYLAGSEERLEHLIETVFDRGQCFVYGFEPFVESVETAIQSAGGDPSDAKIENFG